MSEIPTSRGDGCLICLLQASDSMRATAYSGPMATKIAAAQGVLGRIVKDLVQRRRGRTGAVGTILLIGVGLGLAAFRSRVTAQ